MHFFSISFPFLNPVSAVCLMQAHPNHYTAKSLYTTMHLIYILFECEQKGKDLSMGEYDLNCK